MSKTFLNSKKILLTLSFFLVLVLILLLPNESLAQAGAVESGITKILWTIVSSFFGMFVAFGGWLLDIAIGTFVVGFGNLYATSGLGFAIDNLWSTVRDIFNLTFIFGLVFIGFKMIFDSSDSSARKMLGSLILAALLVNFSLFITKFVIDFSNIAATQFAAAFYNSSTGTYEVSETFMNLLGVSSVLKTMPAGSGFAYIFGSLILFIVSAFVFGAGGIILMIRFAVLNIYMVLSPLMFLGMVFPGLSGVSKSYWSGFFSKAFYAPAYILMLYLANQVLVNMQGVTGGADMSNIFKGGVGEAQYAATQASFASTIPFFILTCVFLIASLVVAQKMGAQGATSALAIGNRWKDKARYAAFAPGRKVARFAAGNLAKYGEMANNSLQRTKAGRLSKIGLTAITLGAFDERSRQAAIAAGKSAKFGGAYSYQDDQDFSKKLTQKENNLIAEKQRTDVFEAAASKLKDTSVVHLKDDLTKALENLAKTMKDMTKEEKERLSVEQLSDKNIAVNLSDSDIEALEKSGSFGAADVKKIKDARKDAYASVAYGGSTLATKDAVGNITYTHANAADIDTRASFINKGTRDVGKLPVDVFKQEKMYAHITPTMLEERMRNGIDPADLQGIRDALNAHFDFGGLSPAEVARNFPDMPDIKKNPWVKWENGNSNYAAQFFV